MAAEERAVEVEERAEVAADLVVGKDSEGGSVEEVEKEVRVEDQLQGRRCAPTACRFSSSPWKEAWVDAEEEEAAAVWAAEGSAPPPSTLPPPLLPPPQPPLPPRPSAAVPRASGCA